jgi:hypothetical protein
VWFCLSVSVAYFSDWFSCVEPSLSFRDKFHLTYDE